MLRRLSRLGEKRQRPTAKFLFPIIKCRLRNPHLSADFFDAIAGFSLFECKSYLFFRITYLFHAGLPHSVRERKAENSTLQRYWTKGRDHIIAGFRNCSLAADILHRSTCFNRLQNGDTLMLGKYGSTHSDLLQGTYAVCRKISKREGFFLQGYLHNYYKPHPSLNNLTPAEYARRSGSLL